MEIGGASRIVHCSLFGWDAYELIGYERPFPNHMHDHFVIGVVERGFRKLVVRGEEYDLQPGMIMLLNPGDAHACKARSEEPLVYRAFNIKPTMLQVICERCFPEPVRFEDPVVEDEFLATELDRCLREVLGWEEDVRSLRALRSSAGKLVMCQWDAGASNKTCVATRPSAEMLSSTAVSLRELLQELVARFSGDSISRESQLVNDACSYLEKHFAEIVTVDDLCELMATSPSTLFRSFAHVLGITPYRYLESVRVEHARALLLQGVSIADVAAQTGFAHQSHLTRVFSAYTGLTPAQFKRS
ncbi:MAG: AraC family transcriptional regulator [Eggerthellaceae bacterium]